MTIPELRKRGYPEFMTVGTLAGAGTLGLLIPPSIIMIVYGVTAEVSISQLFIAGVIPGLLLAALFMGYVAVWAVFNPGKTPASDIRMSFAQKVYASRHLIPAVTLIVLVLGSIYTGIATATEAAAVGVIGALAISAVQGTLTRKAFVEGLMGATRLSCMIALILAGAAFLTLAMGFTGLPRGLAEWIDSLDLSPWMLIAALTVFYVILGCFLDGISMVVLTMAVVLPTVQRAGLDPIWFGIFVVLVVEMAQITPPVGFNLFVLQGMTGHQITYIARAALPLFFLMVVAVTIVTVFPEIVTFLPQKMIATR
jgi:tripartite ATP-independent transporter DctM subunit